MDVFILVFFTGIREYQRLPNSGPENLPLPGDRRKRENYYTVQNLLMGRGGGGLFIKRYNIILVILLQLELEYLAGNSLICKLVLRVYLIIF